MMNYEELYRQAENHAIDLTLCEYISSKCECVSECIAIAYAMGRIEGIRMERAKRNDKV